MPNHLQHRVFLFRFWSTLDSHFHCTIQCDSRSLSVSVLASSELINLYLKRIFSNVHPLPALNFICHIIAHWHNLWRCLWSTSQSDLFFNILNNFVSSSNYIAQLWTNKIALSPMLILVKLLYSLPSTETTVHLFLLSASFYLTYF